METIIRLLKKINPSAEINERTKLIEDHVISSLDMLGFVSDLCEEFSVEILMKDIIPENFSTPEDIFRMIKRLQEEDIR